VAARTLRPHPTRLNRADIARFGALRFNVGAALQALKSREGLTDRILNEADMAKMLVLADGRNHALVRLAYAYTGDLRVSELVGLRWSDLADAADGTLYVTAYGKGRKTRTVRVSAATGNVMRALRADAPLNAFVLRSGTERLIRCRRGGSCAPQRNARGLKRTCRRIFFGMHMRRMHLSEA
jgi:integrase